MKWILPPAALGVIAALAAGCNTRFLLSESPPARPPSFAEIAAKQKQEDEARRQKAAQPSAAPSVAVDATAMKAKPAALRARGDAAPGYGPRLARMLARDELEKLAAAHVQLDVPDRMMAGNRAKVEVRLADELRGEFIKSLQDLGMANAEEIASASSFRAQLSGDGFKIETPPSDDEKTIGTGAAAWSWDVAPTRPGVRSLALTLAARVKVPGGGEEEREMPPIMRKVTVESGAVSAAPLPLQNRWLWIVGAVILLGAAMGGGIAIGRRQRK
jgi:hypothetical protein